MTSPVSSIHNLGPTVESACTQAGINSAEELRELGPDAAYARIIAAGAQPHFIGYYVMVMALQGRPWNDCKGAEKAALRVKFDAIKGANFDQSKSNFEATLDVIGVVKPPPKP